MSTRRNERLSEVVKQEVSKIILYELNDPRISFITIIKADVAPDFKKAKVYVSILGDEATQRKTLRGLEHARGFIQAELGSRLKIRYTPLLEFCLDESVKRVCIFQNLLMKQSKALT